MGDGEGSDPMSRAPIIITPPGRIPGTPILMSAIDRKVVHPVISQVFRCAWTTRGDLGAWNGPGEKGMYVPGPERRIGTDRRRPPRSSIDQLAPWTSRGVSQPWTQH